MPIAELREKIDRIDDKILKLIEERVETAKKVGKAKRRHNMPIQDKERELEIQRRLQEKTGLDKGLLKRVFGAIIRYCRENE